MEDIKLLDKIRSTQALERVEEKKRNRLNSTLSRKKV